VARKIWDWCISRSIWISAVHCPGALNIQADKVSRVFNDDTEWSLGKKEFVKICKHFGVPQVDAFASRLNKKVACYYSWQPDPDAIAVDTFSVNWKYDFIYAFPPFSMVGMMLQKFRVDGGGGILVVPMWTNQPWFCELLTMLVAPPLLLKVRASNLQLEHNPSKIHPLSKNLFLLVCKCSGNPCMQQDYQNTCCQYFRQRDDPVLGPSTQDIWTTGQNFVMRDKLIRLDVHYLMH